MATMTLSIAPLGARVGAWDSWRGASRRCCDRGLVAPIVVASGVATALACARESGTQVEALAYHAAGDWRACGAQNAHNILQLMLHELNVGCVRVDMYAMALVLEGLGDEIDAQLLLLHGVLEVLDVPGLALAWLNSSPGGLALA